MVTWLAFLGLLGGAIATQGLGEALAGLLGAVLIDIPVIWLLGAPIGDLISAWGLVDDATARSMSAMNDDIADLDTGNLDALIGKLEYINGLPSGKTFTYTTVSNEVVTHKEINLGTQNQSGTKPYAPKPKGGGVQEASGTGGWVTVPPGYPGDTYIVAMSSGEKFNVKRPGQPAGGDTFNITINDAAAAMVLMEAKAAAKAGAKAMARLVAYAHAGVEPQLMGLGPIPAVRKVFEKSGLKPADMDVIESNEAFAVQAMAVTKDLGLDPAKVNPNGGAVALGHPIGATGCILTVKALYELERRQKRYALVTMCIGGGQGIAAIFERLA